MQTNYPMKFGGYTLHGTSFDWNINGKLLTKTHELIYTNHELKSIHSLKIIQISKEKWASPWYFILVTLGVP